jgi:chromosome segregation ATPase
LTRNFKGLKHLAMYHGYSDQNHGDLFENDQGMNRSYNSGISSVSPNNASASSSKAVLAALRALQDKIRRLESERAQALDETAQLRHQIKNQEIEAEHIKQRDSLTAQKNLHEVRSAYERILTEKTETEIRLSKLEDRNRQEQQIAADLRSKILSAEEEKHSTLLTIKGSFFSYLLFFFFFFSFHLMKLF